jgi:hypothetical protein
MFSSVISELQKYLSVRHKNEYICEEKNFNMIE